MSEQPASSSFGGLKDFSVDAQRRMFIEQQERERQAAETKKESRKIKRATAGGATSGVELSGLMSNLESGAPSKKVLVGDDDDDSIANDDDWSLNSEESFYVGIERADYAQPDNTEMYGEESKDLDDYELTEDRLGISRVSVAVVNRERSTGKRVALDWDADIPIVHESKSSSLYDFMNGTGSSGGAGSKGNTKKDIVVAMPLIGSCLDWKEESKLGEEDDAAIDQVYQHKAAEGKTFIEKLVGSGNTGEGTPMPGTPAGMSATTPASARAAGGGNYPVLSPMALFSPGITTPGAIVEGEDNGVRQMRERELRKEASVGARQKMMDLKKMIATTKDNTGKVDAYAIMKQLEKMMEDEGNVNSYLG